MRRHGRPYGAAVRTALLTAQRFRKVGQMRRADLKDRIRIQGHMEDGRWVEDQDIGHVWDPTRPDDPKNKRVSVVPLPPLARDIIAKVPIIDVARGKAKDYVFTTTGVGPLGGWSSTRPGWTAECWLCCGSARKHAATIPNRSRSSRGSTAICAAPPAR